MQVVEVARRRATKGPAGGPYVINNTGKEILAEDLVHIIQNAVIAAFLGTRRGIATGTQPGWKCLVKSAGWEDQLENVVTGLQHAPSAGRLGMKRGIASQ